MCRKLWSLFLLVVALCQTVHAYSVRMMSIPSNDLLANPTTGRLYLSEGERYGYRVFVLNPFTEVMENHISVGEMPRSLALSADGSVLYATASYGQNEEGYIAKVTLANGSVTRFPLGRSASGAALAGDGISVHPSNANVLAVVRRAYSGSVEDVSLFRDGVRMSRGSTYPNHSETIAFQPAVGAAPVLYGVDSSGTLRTMSIEADGLTLTNSVPGLLRSSSSGPIRHASFIVPADVWLMALTAA
jgi:DNA-binding beta-propeller fold protein YncE